ncbi:penicillin-binding protein 1C [Roseomonas sp. CCTCC AB2023176]|uniref:penicillin-binding protein 1C n=1 Tax=Roseomonas sp. CCTCC AB2023176 TaxID=3342640 RepID=UPI0035DE9BFC
MALVAASGVIAVGAAFLVADRLLPPDLSRLETTGQVVVDRDGRTLAALPAPGGIWRLPVRASDVPPHLLDLLIAAEDRRFRWHPGVDPVALARAAAQWVRAGRVVSGGSTVSMQAARLLEPRPRTLRSKAIEAFRAMQLEWRYGKEGVLRIWLTLAPQGGNLEGVRAGSLAWLGRPVERLGVAEAALLVAIPRRPEALRPDRHPVAAIEARDKLLRVRGAPALPASEREAATAEGAPSARHPMPNLSPHLSRQAARAAGEGVVRTSLDATLQRGTEALAREVLAGLPGRASVAIVIADLRTREIRALVGGEWMAEGRAGALDLTRAVRSPGSALKPLLYAMAFERGLVTPGTVLEDMPRRFGDYAPENFARGFSGRVTAASALRQSLNLPAVALMEAVGPLRFSSAMKALGATPRLPPGAGAALPLALGGAGVTLRELVGVTAALGDGGRAGPVRAMPGTVAGEQVVAAAAAASVAAILTQPFPGGGPEGVAWKTGTSWGGRDAWAVGFDARHVAGVWVGRPDGTPIPGLTGRSHAIPVLSRAFGLLPANPRPRPDAFRAEAGGAQRAADGLRLLFPPPNAVVEEGAMTLRAAGGQRPLTFLVDGVPLPAEPARRDVAWLPPGPGFYRVTVLDAEGRAATAPVRVRGSE